LKELFIVALGLLIYRGALADDASVKLKPGPGDNVASVYCSSCHTLNYIVMNSTFLSPEAWKAEMDKMRWVFGASIDDATATKIIAYLAAHYAVNEKP
jgi:mono/diheme cytochrome c family protein